VKAGRDHHAHIGGRCRPHQEQGAHSNHEYRSNERPRFHTLPPARILTDIVPRQMSLLKEGGREFAPLEGGQRRRMILFSARQKVRAMLR
jgi:hypothetical protein